jgi:hypothetical protein
MNFTNRTNIASASVLDALRGDDYDLNERPANVFSCTEIIDAPKAKQLQRRHEKEIVVDYADNFWKLDGSAVHYSVEMSNKKTDKERLSEERIFIEVSSTHDLKAHTLGKGEKIADAPWYSADHFYLSVKFDNYEVDGGVVEDYKRTSAWEAVFGIKESRIQQLNIGALGLRLLGFPTAKVRACLFLKDWSRKDAASAQQRNTYYPEIPYKEVDCPLWNDEYTAAYIIERLKLHVAAQAAADDAIPECSPDERWYRGEALAVMKEGNKTATRVFKIDGDRAEQEVLANTCLASLKAEYPKNKYRIDVRPGQDTRCLSYCSCKQFCSYWKNVHSVQNVPIEEVENG